MGRFVVTEFRTLLPVLYPHLRVVKTIPASGDILLLREPTKTEVTMLKTVYRGDFIVVSDTYGKEVIGREEILARAKLVQGSRKKPSNYDKISNEEFTDRVRKFIVNDIWAETRGEQTLFDLFSHIDSTERFRVLFRLLPTHHPDLIMASLCTFISRCTREELRKGVTYAYKRVIVAKERRVRRNAMSALRSYVTTEGDAAFRCLVFVDRLGG